MQGCGDATVCDGIRTWGGTKSLASTGGGSDVADDVMERLSDPIGISSTHAMAWQQGVQCGIGAKTGHFR